MDETALIELWRPAARRAAELVARRCWVNTQERADLYDNAIVALWERIRKGDVKADTSPRLVVFLVREKLMFRGFTGFKNWRPNAYSQEQPDGTFLRRYLPSQNMTDTFETAAARRRVIECIPDRGAAQSDPEELVDRIALGCGLTEREREALVGRACGEQPRETARRLGTRRNCIQSRLASAIAKLRLRNPRLLEMLT